MAHQTLRQRFFSRKALKKSVIILGVLAIIYLLIASLLIFWPRELPFVGVQNAQSEDVSIAAPPSAEDVAFQSRDGVNLSGRVFGPPADTIIVFLHGVASDQTQLASPADTLAGLTGAQVLTLDLRGHGRSQGARNDVEYIGQYTDDLADIMRILREEQPARQVIIAGHSMGGGIAMRYALKDDVPEPAGYLLFAPNFGEGPTEGNDDASASEESVPPFVHFDLPRMIGQIMMNTVGVKAFDDEPVLFFNTSPRIQAYSYRAVLSGQPIRPQLSDQALQAIDVPLLVLIGSDDEVFNADAYAPFVSANSEGDTRSIAGADHNGILESDSAFVEIERWIREEKLVPVSASTQNEIPAQER